MFNLADLLQSPVGLHLSSDDGSTTVHVHPNLLTPISEFMATLFSGRWPSDCQTQHVSLPPNVTLRGAMDLILFMHNGCPPFAAQCDESRRLEFVAAVDYFGLRRDRLQVPLDPAFLYRDAPPRHPSLELEPPKEGGNGRWRIISSRKAAANCFGYANHRSYVAARLRTGPMNSFRFVVELEGHWQRKDRLLLGGLPLACSLNDEYILTSDPPKWSDRKSRPISGVWFSVSSGRVLGGHGQRLYQATGDQGAKQPGTQFGFEVTPFCVRVGTTNSTGTLEWHAVSVDSGDFDVEYSPALLFQPHARQDDLMAAVSIVEVTDIDD